MASSKPKREACGYAAAPRVVVTGSVKRGKGSSENRLPGPLVYSDAGGAREGGVTTEEALKKRNPSAGRTHATCTGAARAAAKAPGTALMWATWQQIGQASTEPGPSTCHQAAPVARNAIPAKAATKTAKRSDRIRRGALIFEGSIIFKKALGARFFPEMTIG